MAFRSTPQLGPSLEGVINPGEVWFDVPGKMTLISPRLGNRETGTDGHEYILVRASAAIAAATPGTFVTITEPAFTAAAGGSTFRAPSAAMAAGGVPINAFFWARKEAL